MDVAERLNRTMSALKTAQRILTINTGSTSVKCERYDLVEGDHAIAAPPEPVSEFETSIDQAEKALAGYLREPVDVVAHRMVRMPTGLHAVQRLDEASLAALTAAGADAPLHNSAALRLVRIIATLQPEAAQYGVSDSAFHATLSAAARTYALPQDLTRSGLERVGFHGLSHEYAASRGCADVARDIGSSRVVTAHLGGGSSLCAIRNGESIDTTMGFTPLDGVPMATRSGAVDPGLLLHLLRGGMSVNELEQMLEHASGLLGISGISDDVRVLLASSEPGAELALAVLAWRVRAALGAMIATLGGIDVLVFTGGIGEHAVPVREAILQGGLGLGITTDRAKSAVPVLVVAAREGWQLARKTLARLYAAVP